MSAYNPALSPVRIYVLWHPKFAEGLVLARRIYYWFRLETMEGIPVFLRSECGPDAKAPPEIPDDCQINYIIPLVEAHMVACPRWRAYVADFAAPAAPRNSTDRLYPVAIDPVAYQMPAIMRNLNYIRHNLRQSPPPETEGLLGQLTEVLCRDLRSELHEMRKPNDLKQRNASDSQSLKQASRPLRTGKLKIFLSHAKADGTKTPVALKEYILGKTQCEPRPLPPLAAGRRATCCKFSLARDSPGAVLPFHGQGYSQGIEPEICCRPKKHHSGSH